LYWGFFNFRVITHGLERENLPEWWKMGWTLPIGNLRIFTFFLICHIAVIVTAFIMEVFGLGSWIYGAVD
jgi:hypothetical protein